ncbi:GumC family protein [Amaricoccus solimangrovi]|uniref:non-specific protein-tyrosine kinase n=1 Tax=Amaricoccus solimangrovi TaxID=2589815 RepID=A0A501WLU5_9RHOB|nr:polysaccharide biosynthesis tyrosine autokinase [Amaricoccus solimangrovi]TPE49124.1 polysaccharide biosynthesis tyrosine autokinase [Amaricoccus solimangrovi]
MESKPRYMIASSTDSDTIDLSKIFNILLRKKYWIIFSAIVLTALAFAYVEFLATPTYRATSTVVMDSREAQVTGLDVESILGSLSSDSTAVNTEVEVFQGRMLMGRVVDDLKLVEDPEFNQLLNPPGLVSRIRTFLLGAPPALSENEIRDGVVTALLDQVVTTNIPQSLAFQIQVETESAEKSARIADTIARLYIDDQVRVKFEATKRAAEWLTGQVTGLKAELEAAEKKIREFQSGMSIASAEELAALDRQLKDTRDRRAASEAQANTLLARQQALESASGRGGQAAALNDPQLIELAVAADAGDAEAVSAFEARRDLLGRQMAQDLLRLRGQVDSYALAEKNLLDTINRDSRELTQLEQMTREAEASKLLYEHFQTRLKETIAQQGIQQPDSRVLSQAVRPLRAATPRKGLILVMAALLGAMLGAGLALLREAASTGLRTANDLEALTGRVVLGQIPLLPERQRAKVLSYLARNPTSALAESVRNLRTSILLSNVDRAPQVIALSSSVPSEGKTTLTLALAQNLTLMGKKVLVVEGDIRRRMFKRYLDLPQGSKGLVSVLSGEVSLAQAACPTSELGDVLLGEKTAVNAADLFSSQAFPRFLAEARKIYDVILIDTPPVLVVPDTRIIAQHADAVVFIVRWDHTPETQVRDSLHMLDTTNARIAGMVLSQIDPKGMRRYGYGERYGAYAAYGKKYYNTAE